MKAYKYPIIAAMLAGYCCGVGPARVQNESENDINYVYSSWIGSGFYSVSDRTVYLLRAPFSYTLREADSEKWGLELLLPATIGFHDFSDGQDNHSTFTFVPGAQFTYPLLENWSLKPFGQFGFGKDFSGSDIAWIYGAGIINPAEKYVLFSVFYSMKRAWKKSMQENSALMHSSRFAIKLFDLGNKVESIARSVPLPVFIVPAV